MSIDPKEELDEAHFGFSNQTYLNAILFVPYGTKEKYLETYPWKNFFDIREMNIFDMWNGTNSVYEPTSLHSVRNCNNLKVSTDKELLTIENIEIGDIINIFNNNGSNYNSAWIFAESDGAIVR